MTCGNSQTKFSLNFIDFYFIYFYLLLPFVPSNCFVPISLNYLIQPPDALNTDSTQPQP